MFGVSIIQQLGNLHVLVQLSCPRRQARCASAKLPPQAGWLTQAVSSVGLEGLLVRPLAFQLGGLPLMHATFGLRRPYFSFLWMIIWRSGVLVPKKIIAAKTKWCQRCVYNILWLFLLRPLLACSLGNLSLINLAFWLAQAFLFTLAGAVLTLLVVEDLELRSFSYHPALSLIAGPVFFLCLLYLSQSELRGGVVL
eukprot:1141653-Pelagomonas_calceolata.AAC.3